MKKTVIYIIDKCSCPIHQRFPNFRTHYHSTNLCQRQLCSVSAVHGQASVDTPSNVVELNKHIGDLLVGRDLEEVESVDTELLCANPSESPVP